VERLFMQIGSVRISLHRIHSCPPEEALLHPHPWPASFKIYKNQYFTQVGVSKTAEPPKDFTSMILGPGSMVRMTNPNEWHLIAPMGNCHTYTMMVTTTPYDSDEVNPGYKRPNRTLKPLKEETKKEILTEFKISMQNLYDER